MKTKRTEYYFEKVWGISKAAFRKKAAATKKKKKITAEIASQAAKNHNPAIIQQIPHNILNG